MDYNAPPEREYAARSGGACGHFAGQEKPIGKMTRVYTGCTTRPTTAEDQYQTQLARYERADPTDNSNRGEGWWRWQNIKHNYDLIQFGYPTVYLNDEQQTFMDENSTIINDYVMQMEAKFITGAASIDGEFDGFIEELKKLGAEEYEKIYQDVYVK